jgi:alpha-L-fucosidase
MKSLFFRSSILALLASLLIFSSCKPKVQEITEAERLQWWNDAKFGLFIHWGVYSVPAGTYEGKKIDGIGEWIMYNGNIPVANYKEFAKSFNPVKYDPEAWVKMAKDAGMKYIVITSKHHDGFALFNSKVTDWNVVDATPYGKDLLKPLYKACKREGIKLGFYYSQAQDWTHPGGGAFKPKWDSAQNGSFDSYLDKIAVPQVKEILSRYGEMDILWWDTPVGMTKERAEKFLPVVAEHPRLITNNRLGGGYEGDSETPEQSIPATGFPGRNWEVCMTMNDTWGYKSYDNNWKSGKELILKLSDIVSKGGNFLLNVGPTSLGEIPQPSIDRLKQIGDWMKINSEAIYGTKASPFPYLPWGRATIKDQKLYLHVINWPADGLLKLPLMNKAGKAYLLSDKETPLNLIQADQHIEISVPTDSPDSVLSIVVLEFEGTPKVLPAPTTGKTGTASSVDTLSSVSNLFDGDPLNSWKPAPGEIKATVDVDLGEDVKIGNISLVEPWRPWDNHGQGFQLQVKKGEKWEPVTEGKTDGCGHTQDFTPVTGRYFRILITGGKGEVPVLNEWILNRVL